MQMHENEYEQEAEAVGGQPAAGVGRVALLQGHPVRHFPKPCRISETIVDDSSSIFSLSLSSITGLYSDPPLSDDDDDAIAPHDHQSPTTPLTLPSDALSNFSKL